MTEEQDDKNPLFYIRDNSIMTYSGQVVATSESKAWLEFARDAVEEKFDRNVMLAKGELEKLKYEIGELQEKIRVQSEEITVLRLELSLEANANKRLLAAGLTEVTSDASDPKNQASSRSMKLSALFYEVFKQKETTDKRIEQVVIERDQAIQSAKNLVETLQRMEENYNYLLKLNGTLEGSPATEDTKSRL